MTIEDTIATMAAVSQVPGVGVALVEDGRSQLDERLWGPHV
jgi:hypothetical protein